MHVFIYLMSSSILEKFISSTNTHTHKQWHWPDFHHQENVKEMNGFRIRQYAYQCALSLYFLDLSKVYKRRIHIWWHRIYVFYWSFENDELRYEFYYVHSYIYTSLIVQRDLRFDKHHHRKTTTISTHEATAWWWWWAFTQNNDNNNNNNNGLKFARWDSSK